jgi:hypothetical protein
MEIDIYRQCPCFSGKKIKFCCGKDLAGELNQIVTKCQSEQFHSALDQIEQVIAKNGERDCLLVLRTYACLMLHDYERASQSNATFLARHPQSPIGIMHDATLKLANADLRGGVDRLQDAVDSVRGEEFPLILANRFQEVGAILSASGHVFAARAHLEFAAMLNGLSSQDIQRIGFEAVRADVPLIIKTDYRLYPVPQQKEWSGKYANVLRAMDRGQFRLALKILERLDQLWPDQLEIVFGLALLHSVLADSDQMSPAWNRLSYLPQLPRWLAVEYQAMAQVLSPADETDLWQVVAREFELTQIEPALDRLASSKRLVKFESAAEIQYDDGPPPREAFSLLDRDRVASCQGLTAIDMPRVIGELLVFGKETDRPARLVLVAAKNDQFENSVGFLRGCLGDYLVDRQQERVVDTVSKVEDAISWNLQLPDDVDYDRYHAYQSEFRRHCLLENWPQVAMSCLNGMTPQQAASLSERGFELEAQLFLMEYSAVLQQEVDVITDLKRKLGIEIRDRRDPSTLEGEQLTPIRVTGIDVKLLTDEQVQRLFEESYATGNRVAMRELIPEMLDRPSLTNVIPRAFCYLAMAYLTDDAKKGLEYFQLMRQEARSEGKSIGLMLVREFEYRLTRRIPENLGELLRTIQTRYMQEPDVEYQLGRVLKQFGLVDSDGTFVRKKVPVRHTEKSSPVIWTPDAARDEIGDGAERQPSRIWVPGAD